MSSTSTHPAITRRGLFGLGEAATAALGWAGQHGGGVVLAPPGTYTLSGPIWMRWSKVVLRGADRDSTVRPTGAAPKKVEEP